MARRKGCLQGGRMIYVPKLVIDELNNIKSEDKISRNAEAFERMARNCRVARVKVKKRDRMSVF